MQLVINTYGPYLRKSGDCFLVKTDEKIYEISAKKVESIMIATSAYLSTELSCWGWYNALLEVR